MPSYRPNLTQQRLLLRCDGMAMTRMKRRTLKFRLRRVSWGRELSAWVWQSSSSEYSACGSSRSARSATVSGSCQHLQPRCPLSTRGRRTLDYCDNPAWRHRRRLPVLSCQHRGTTSALTEWPWPSRSRSRPTPLWPNDFDLDAEGKWPDSW